MSDLAPVDGIPVYEWKRHHNQAGTEIDIAEVQEKGQIVTYGGQVQPVKPGDYVARTNNPSYFVLVHDMDDWTEGEFEGTPKTDDDVEEYKQFDPAEHTVADVKAHIDAARSEDDQAEVDRVLAREQATRNRAGLADY